MAGYIGSQTPVVSNGSQRKYTFTATAAQTVFTGMDIPNPQQIQVFQNGVRLVITTDYTVSSGTTVTLVNAASAGDSLVVILFADYQLLDTDALTFTGGTTIEGDLTVDTNTLYVDSTNNRVGIGTSSIPAEAKAMVSGGRFYVNSQDQYSVLLQNSGTSGGFIGTTAANTINFFNSSGTERIRIDSSGNVGIGTSSPSSYNANIDDLVVSNAASGGITIATGTTSQGAVAFADGTSGSSPVMGRIRYDHSVNEMDFRVNNAEVMRIDSSGNLLFEHTDFASGWGSTNRAAIAVGGNYKFWSSRDSTTSRGHIIFYNPNGAVGSITTSGSATAFNTSSDHRLKENVTDVTDGITRVKQLEPKRFNFIADPDTTVDGFLAHEAQAVVPEAVTGTHNEVDDDGNAVMQGIDQSKLVPLLTAALKEAITKIETLETEMTSVKARLDALEGN